MLARGAAHAGDLKRLFSHEFPSARGMCGIPRGTKCFLDLLRCGLGTNARAAHANLLRMRAGQCIDRPHDAANATTAVHVLDNKVQCGHNDSMLESGGSVHVAEPGYGSGTKR